MGIRTIDWPPLFARLKSYREPLGVDEREIYKLYSELEFVNDTEETLEALISVAKEVWHAINQSVLYNLSITMSYRV